MHIDPEQHQGPVTPLRVDRQEDIARRLRGLPQETPQPYDWAQFQRRAREYSQDAARGDEINRKFAALAAAIVLAVVGLATWARLSHPDMLSQVVTHHPSAHDSGARVATSEQRVARADAAEVWLARLPSDPVVVRVGTRAVVTGLEDEIAQLDDYLSAARVEGVQPAKLADVEQQRALLVDSLVRVRYAEALVSASR